MLSFVIIVLLFLLIFVIVIIVIICISIIIIIHLYMTDCCGVNRVCVVQEHPFFGNIDWSRVLKMKLKAVFLPRPSHEEDLSYFDARNEDFPIGSTSHRTTRDTRHDTHGTRHATREWHR